MSRSSDMITHTTWPSVHISFCLAIHSSPSLHLFSLTLSSSLHHPHLFFTPCVISLSLPTTPPISTSLIACYSPLSLSLSLPCVSTISSPLLPCSARNRWNQQLQNSDQPLYGLRSLAKLPFRLINTSNGCG